MTLSLRAGVAAALYFSSVANAVYYKIGSKDEIKQSARTLAYDGMLQYHGNETGQIPGCLPGPPASGTGDYYWYQGGAMMGIYIDYWYYTGDPSYNSVVMQGIQHQTGDFNNFEPTNWTLSLGNDDQAFWGYTALLAAENKFPNPPDDKPQWLELAQGTWNAQNSPERHDSKCGGGMRWQVPSFNNGYDYKNTVANAGFMNIGARLAHYTGNNTYSDRASETWDWMWSKNYINHDDWSVYDGGHVADECKTVSKETFTYNAALLIQATAFMYAHTKDKKWQERMDGLISGFEKNCVKNGIIYEPNCEPQKVCKPDMLWFKGYSIRWFAQVTKLDIDDSSKQKLQDIIDKSTTAAINQCTGGPQGRTCGFYWLTGQFVPPADSHTSGAGEVMNVLGAVSSLLAPDVKPPATAKTGGISKGDPNAGNGGKIQYGRKLKDITTADRAGAGILTAMLIGGCVYMYVWMSL